MKTNHQHNEQQNKDGQDDHSEEFVIGRHPVVAALKSEIRSINYLFNPESRMTTTLFQR